MSVELVKAEIVKFLASAKAEVLCIRGKWGVGKTHTWTEQLKKADKVKDGIPLRRYSYVSLFGVNSLDELKFAVFENVILLDQGLKKADLDTLDAFVSSKVGWRKYARLAQSLPGIRSMISSEATGLVSFMTIRDQIVCIDDLERRGEKLSIGDVLGLISYLREQRNCKIVLILNDEALEGKDRELYESHLEKVVDVSLVYKPSPEYAADIGIPSEHPLRAQLRERCVSLGITNIRVMKRLLRHIEAIQPMLKNFDPEVLNVTLGSLVLFSWSHDQPKEAPPLKFLLDKTEAKFVANRKKEVTTEEAAWNALLAEYGYAWTDDFDLTLIEGVQNGYFDPEKIFKHGSELNEKLLATRADGSFEEAWNTYHDTFNDNKDEALTTLYESFMRNVKYITPTNLNGTITLFKELGRPDQAKTMIDHYMKQRNEERAFFDLDESMFGGNVTDPDIRAAFKERSAHTEERRDVPALLLSIKNGWTQEAISELASTPVEEYRKAFKNAAGKDLRAMIANALQFNRISNANDEMLEISRRAKAALKLIGEESEINARRVARYGVIIENLSRE